MGRWGRWAGGDGGNRPIGPQGTVGRFALSPTAHPTLNSRFAPSSPAEGVKGAIGKPPYFPFDDTYSHSQYTPSVAR